MIHVTGSIGTETYRLGGNCVTRLRLRSIGSNDLMVSSDGPGALSEDDGSTSSETSAVPDRLEAFRWPLREVWERSCLDLFPLIDASRNGNFGVAMLY